MQTQFNELTDAQWLIIDSQSVKIASFIPDDKGIDGGKRVNGRKRHILTDTLGLIIAVMVTSANTHDGAAGCSLFNHVFQHVENKLKNTNVYLQTTLIVKNLKSSLKKKVSN